MLKIYYLKFESHAVTLHVTLPSCLSHWTLACIAAGELISVKGCRFVGLRVWGDPNVPAANAMSSQNRACSHISKSDNFGNFKNVFKIYYNLVVKWQYSCWFMVLLWHWSFWSMQALYDNLNDIHVMLIMWTSKLCFLERAEQLSSSNWYDWSSVIYIYIYLHFIFTDILSWLKMFYS